MKTIAIISQKGGAGKTTLAVNLAVAAEYAKKKSVIIDIDGQASATSWGDSRSSNSPVVVLAQPVRLKNVLVAAEENGVDFVFIEIQPRNRKVPR